MVLQKVNPTKVLAAHEKRAKLTGKIALYCALFAFLHFALDFAQGVYQAAIFDLCIALAIFGCYILYRINYVKLAKVLGLLLMNIAMVLYASVVPKEVGVYLFFFPLMTISASLFGPDEKLERYALIGIPFFFLVFLFVTDFDFLGGYAFESPPGTKIFFIINIISSGAMSIMCIDFMLNLNEESEKELQRLAEEVNAKNLDLQKTNSELDRFLYSTSHDLRSPLSSIKGLINVARYDTTDPKIHGYFNMMTDRVDRLEYFIKDIIDYSKNTRTSVNPENVNCKSLVEEVVDQLKYVEGAQEITFIREIEVDSTVLLDKGRLDVIFANLLANAIKYHDFSKLEKWIKISVKQSVEGLELSVSDNGIGIAPDHQQRIFDMFFRGTIKSSGSGLGLFIVKQTVEKMGGTIRLVSSPGSGSTFTVSLPAAF
jgi:signal transduction histidine kinase